MQFSVMCAGLLSAPHSSHESNNTLVYVFFDLHVLTSGKHLDYRISVLFILLLIYLSFVFV